MRLTVFVSGAVGPAAEMPPPAPRAGSGRLQQRVVEHIARAIAVAADGAGLRECVAIVLIQAYLRQRAAAVVDVAEHVRRADGHGRGGDAGRSVVDVVAPHAHVYAAAFGLDAVVPGVLHAVAVHVAVGAGPPLVRVIVAAADGVHVVVLLVGAPHFVVADDVVAAALVRGDRVRAGRVAPIPAIGAVARVVHFIALDDVAINVAHVVVAARGDAGVLVGTELPAGGIGAAQAAPAADIVVLDDDVMLAGLHQDAVVLAASDGEPAHDDVVRRDADGDGLRVADVDDRAGRRLIEHVAARRTALGHVECRRLTADRNGLRDRELLAPCRRRRLHCVSRSDAELHVVRRARRQVDNAAAALVVAAVVPEVEALAPRGVTRFAELHDAARGAGIRRRRPVEARRVEGRDRLAARRETGGRCRRRRRAGVLHVHADDVVARIAAGVGHRRRERMRAVGELRGVDHALRTVSGRRVGVERRRVHLERDARHAARGVGVATRAAAQHTLDSGTGQWRLEPHVERARLRCRRRRRATRRWRR